MGEPQYDGGDMNRHYEFEEYRELRKQHTALLDALADLEQEMTVHHDDYVVFYAGQLAALLKETP